MLGSEEVTQDTDFYLYVLFCSEDFVVIFCLHLILRSTDTDFSTANANEYIMPIGHLISRSSFLVLSQYFLIWMLIKKQKTRHKTTNCGCPRLLRNTVNPFSIISFATITYSLHIHSLNKQTKKLNTRLLGI